MAANARQISVIVDADSAPLQAAVGKAADSLKGLGEVLAKQNQAAIAGGRETVKSNQVVADSYGRMSGAVRGSVLHIVESIKTQAAEQRAMAAGAVSAAGQVAGASQEQARAYARTAEAATVSADKQAAASRRTVQAAEGAAAGTTRAAQSQVRGYGAAEGALASFGKKALLTATGVVGASVYMAARFEQSTLRLQTQAGASAKQVEALRAGMLRMAGSLGQTPEHLETGMYHVVSSMNKMLPPTTRVSEELKVLKIAAEGAAIGGTNMEETSYALASAMNALHLKASDAEKTMGTLNAIVGTGDMTMNDLLDSLKSGLIPTAGTFGSNLQSVGAALAVFGDEGIRGAEAGTKLRMMFALLGGPTKKSAEILEAVGVPAGEVKAKFDAMSTALAEAGVSTTRVSEDLRKPDGIYVALSDLKHHLEASGLSATAAAAVISRAFGGGRTGAGITLLLRDLPRVKASFEANQKGAASFASAWEHQQHTLTQQAKDLGAEVEVLGVKFGNKLIPTVKDAVGTLKEVGHWLGQNKEEARALEGVIATGLGVAVAAFTVNKLGKMVSGLKEAAHLLHLPGMTGGAVGGGGGRGVAGGISGVRGPEGAGSLANPIAVTQEGGGRGAGGAAGGAATAAEAAGAAGAAESAMPLAGRLATRSPLGVATGIVLLGKGLAEGGGPRTIQTPGNIGKGFLHGADPSQLVTSPLNAILGTHIPSFTGALGIVPNKLGFDPYEHPDLAVRYMLTGKLPGQGVTAPKTPAERKFATERGPGTAQANEPGRHPSGPERETSVASTQRRVESDKALIASHKKLVTSAAEVEQQEAKLDTMRKQGKTGTSSYKAAIIHLAETEGRHARAVAEMAGAEAKHFTTVRQKAEAELARTDAALKTHPSAATVGTISANYARVVGAIKAEMDAGVLTVAEGTKQINATLSNEGKALGITISTAGLSAQAKGEAAVKKAEHKAQGGLVQLGRHGDSGKDSIPMSVGGTNIVAAPGEQVAVFTRHQQEVANAALAPMGGLPGLFSKVNRPHYMAQGGIIPGLGGVKAGVANVASDVVRHFPNLAVTSTTGGGHATNSLHYLGEAVDLAADTTTMLRAASWAAAHYGPSLEEGIHNPNLSYKHGAPVAASFWGSTTWAEHLNHIHLGVLGGTVAAIKNAVAGAFAGGGPGASSITAPHVTGGGAVAHIAQAALNKVAAAATQKLSAGGGPEGASGGKAAGNAQMRAWAAAGLQAAGVSASPGNVSTIVARMMQESGGNPRSINLTDSNAQAGHPSKGLMQTIPETFATYHVPGTSSDIYNPVANVAAAVRYMLARYHHLVGSGPGGYAKGGFVNAATGHLATLGRRTIGKEKPTGKGHKPSPTLAALIHKLGAVPDTENVKALQPYAPALGKLASQKDMLSRIQSLPESKGTLTEGDATILRSIGLNVTAGQSMGGVAENLIKAELGKNEELVGAEQGVQAQWKTLVGEYRERQAQIRKHEEREYHRLTNIKAHIGRLTTGQLKSRVAAASHKAHDQALISDARASEQALAENIAGERQLPAKSQDKKRLAAWEAEKRRLGGYISNLSKPPSAKGAALVALRKNELTNELGPLEDNLFTLGGSRTAIGHSGQYGTVGGYIKTLNDGIGKEGNLIVEGQQSTIPGLKIELEAQRERNREAGATPEGESVQQSAMNSLLKQQVQQLAETASIQGAQLATFKAFIPQIPKYEKGGPVVNDGLIYAHKGEHVVPAGGTLISNSQPANVKVDNHFHGVGGELIALIDSRVTHPENVREVSRHMAQRTNMLTGRAG